MPPPKESEDAQRLMEEQGAVGSGAGEGATGRCCHACRAHIEREAVGTVVHART